jgi:hypothetical protein
MVIPSVLAISARLECWAKYERRSGTGTHARLVSELAADHGSTPCLATSSASLLQAANAT